MLEHKYRHKYSLTYFNFTLVIVSMKAQFITLFLFSTLISFAQISENVTLLGHWDREDVQPNGGGAKYNEAWGFAWNGREYGVIGSTLGTHIIALNALKPLEEVAYIPGRKQGEITHRDYHVYKNYLYAVGDQGPASLQIIDFKHLPHSVEVVYDSDALVNTAHNVRIDTATAKMYVLGPQGLAMSVYSLQDPENPVLLKNFQDVEYVHDAFIRNDTAYLHCGGQGMYVYDFSDAQNPVQLGVLDFYDEKGYNHSGWLSEDGKTYVFADESEGMRMKVCDVTVLTDIQVLALFNSGESQKTVPHNLHLKDGFVYVSHYNDGLQIFDIRDRGNPIKAGYYDTYPEEHTSNFRGAWGVYAFLPSGRIVITDRQTGLYLFKFNVPPKIETEQEHNFFPNPFKEETVFYYENPHSLQFELYLYDMQGKLVYKSEPNTGDWVQIERGDIANGIYLYEYRGLDNKLIKRGKVMAN